ncbi:MAG: polysaccharide deacetylase family protein [Bacteroidota bacterium]
MNKVALLTIDDSPNEFTHEKVDLLEKHCVPAIFFCLGDSIDKYSESLVYAVKKGFVIGNHSYSHQQFSRLSVKRCIEEIKATDELISKIYRKAKVPQGVKYFRYPYGIKGDIVLGSPKMLLLKCNRKFLTIEENLKKLNYGRLNMSGCKFRYPESLMCYNRDVFWTFDIREWLIFKKDASLKSIEKRIDKNLSYNKGKEIILMHDHIGSHLYFEHLLKRLLLKDFQFVG